VFNQFSEHSAHLNSEAGYFYGKPTKYGVPDPIPIMGGGPHYRSLFDRGYHDGNMAIARFNAADWPAAQDDIKRMMSDVLNRMMTYIQQQISPRAHGPQGLLFPLPSPWSIAKCCSKLAITTPGHAPVTCMRFCTCKGSH
jgi:hypothetical protein